MSQHNVTDTIPEWRLQASVAAHLNEIGQAFAASLEGVKLNAYQAQMAKATGMQAGEPDLRLYFLSGRVVFIELKAEKGRVHKPQRERIELLRGLGFTVHLVRAATPDEAVLYVAHIVALERADPSASAMLDSAAEIK